MEWVVGILTLLVLVAGLGWRVWQRRANLEVKIIEQYPETFCLPHQAPSGAAYAEISMVVTNRSSIGDGLAHVDPRMLEPVEVEGFLIRPAETKGQTRRTLEEYPFELVYELKGSIADYPCVQSLEPHATVQVTLHVAFVLSDERHWQEFEEWTKRGEEARIEVCYRSNRSDKTQACGPTTVKQFADFDHLLVS